jgi:hypothetical protein
MAGAAVGWVEIFCEDIIRDWLDGIVMRTVVSAGPAFCGPLYMPFRACEASGAQHNVNAETTTHNIRQNAN